MNAKASAITRNKVRKASKMIDALKKMSNTASTESGTTGSRTTSKLDQLKDLNNHRSSENTRTSKKHQRTSLEKQSLTVAEWAHGTISNDLNDSNSAVSVYGTSQTGDINVNKDWLSKEVDFLRSVENKHVIRVFEYNKANGKARIEKVQATLESQLTAHGNISAIAARRLLMEMLGALSAYHDQSLIHGELDCDRILVSPDARYLLAGSPGFKPNREFRLPGVDRCVAPELLNPTEFGQPSAATDLYCLGHVILKAALGEQYFEAIKSQQTNATKRLSIAQWHGSNVDRFPPLIEFLREAPDLYPVLERMIRKNVAERYSDIRSVMTDLERLTFDQSGAVGRNSKGKVARPIQTKKQKSNPASSVNSGNSETEKNGSRKHKFLVPVMAAFSLVVVFAMASSTHGNAKKEEEPPLMLDLGKCVVLEADSGLDETVEAEPLPPLRGETHELDDRNSNTTDEGVSFIKDVANSLFKEVDRPRRRVRKTRERKPVVPAPEKVEPTFKPETEFVTPVLGLNRTYLTSLEGKDKTKYEQLVKEIFAILTNEEWDRKKDRNRVFALFKQAKKKFPHDLRLPLLVSFGMELQRDKTVSFDACKMAVKNRDQFLKELFADADLWLALAPSLQKIRLMAKSKRTDDISRTVDQCVAFPDELRKYFRGSDDIEAAQNAARLIACVFHRLEIRSRSRKSSKNVQNLDSYVLKIEHGFGVIDPRIANSFISCREMLRGDDQRLEFLDMINGYVEMRSIMQSFSR